MFDSEPSNELIIMLEALREVKDGTMEYGVTFISTHHIISTKCHWPLNHLQVNMVEHDRPEPVGIVILDQHHLLNAQHSGIDWMFHLLNIHKLQPTLFL